MIVVVSALILALAANALIAFVVAFYWQAIVIFTLFGVSNFANSHVPWKALGNQDSPQNTFGRFLQVRCSPNYGVNGSKRLDML